jgi:cytochrome c
MKPETALFTGLVAAAGLLGIVAATPAHSQLQPSAAKASNGRQLFQKRCSGCHSLDASKEGPRLRGVYGRRAGSVPGFAYSDALRSANFSWDADSLNRWLTSTDSVVPGNNMDFSVPKPEERAAIIQYLRESSGK